MRILALAHRYVPAHNAGAETVLHALLRALAARGHDVVVHLSRQQGQSYGLDGVHVLTGAATADTARAVVGADVLVAHLECTPAATRLGAWNDRPVVLVHHNNLQVTKEAVTAPGARVDLVVANSLWMQQDLIDHLGGAARPRVVVVRPLVRSAEYATTPGDRVTLINLRRMERSPGGAVMGKGAELFWELAERMPDVKFLGVRGAYGSQMVRVDLPNVEVLDQVPAHEMRDRVYSRTRVLLMPSSYESWGRVGTEALCSGIPVIAHPTPGLVESLGDAGVFMKRHQADRWIAALRLLEDPTLYRAAAARAHLRSAELDPAEDLDRWCNAVEATARNPVGAR